MEWIYRPRRGPEWGSGGIFGLIVHRGVTYFTLSMEAEAHFVHADGFEKVYRFERVGPGPASGGDTYNAVEAVDDSIYFGGWVHAPAVYKGRRGMGGEIGFANKYSHVHEYSIPERSVRLLWKDGIGRESEWAGEVSQIIYDPVNDELLIGRADGSANLGIYAIDRRGGGARKISDVPALKGSLFLDYACFDMQPDWRRGVDGVQCYDLVGKAVHKYVVEDWARISADGHGVEQRGSGYAISAYARYWHFFRGGVLVGNPVEPSLEEPKFVRLFDFGPNAYAPHRANALEVGGGLLAPFNAYSHGYIHGRDDAHRRLFNSPVGPSVLIYIAPPTARIVAALGARVTSMAKDGPSILVAANTAPNLGGLDASPIDVGVRTIMRFDEDRLLSSPSPPATFRVPGALVGASQFGGIPLAGYAWPRLRIVPSKPNRLFVHEYDIGLPPSQISAESYDVGAGPEEIDLGGFSGIVSFRFERADEGSTTYIVLE